MSGNFVKRSYIINMKVDERAVEIIKTLQEAGHGAWVVGGAVRNSMMGLPPKDWDICTTAKAEEVECLFRRTIPMGKAFGIVTVMVGDEGFEVATLRKESGTSDSRHPDEIEFVTDIVTDLGRRDLTINSIAYDPISDVLVDPFDGASDIKRGIIRFVGDPSERIAEDNLRVLRAFRFASQLGFSLHETTWNALQDASLDGVSEERIAEEMNKILLGQHAAHVLASMAIAGVLQKVIPEVQNMIDCDHDTNFHKEVWKPWGATVWSHTLHVVRHATENSKNLDKDDRLVLMWSALLHDCEKLKCKVLKES
jgi:tRNA nucleotidyltransferase (CCA-adding enzyme)